jgi:hypothetical protein
MVAAPLMPEAPPMPFSLGLTPPFDPLKAEGAEFCL